MFRFTLLIAMVGAIVGFAVPPASAANEICAKVWTSGTVLGVHNLGTCRPYTGPTLCADPDLGFEPHAHVYTKICIPD